MPEFAPSSSDFENSEQFERENQFKQRIQERLEGLLKSRSDLVSVAHALRAEAFLTTQEIKGRELVVRFNVEAFVQDQIEKGTFVDLPVEYHKTAEVLVPPNEADIVTGSGAGMPEKEIIPRTKYLAELLSEMGLAYSFVEGQNDPRMMRKLSYLAFITPSIEKMILVNDEEGNATFVIHGFNKEEEDWRKYTSMTKDELKVLPAGTIAVVNYVGTTQEWKDRIKELLLLETAEFKERVSGDKRLENLESAPPGWLTRHELATKLLVSNAAVQKIARGYPELIKVFKRPSGHVSNYFDPDLADIITKEINSREPAPEGWMTNKGLATSLAVDAQTVMRISNKYRQDNPEWYESYMPSLGGKTEHYHPDLVGLIIKEINTSKPAPSGWLTNSSLANIESAGSKTIRRIADKFRADNPKWFVQYKDIGGHVKEHYHPDLIAEIINERRVLPEIAPEGWRTLSGLAKDLKVLGYGSKKIETIADTFRQTRPEWFKVFSDKIKRGREHYHPDLIAKIKAELGK